jgi:transposase
MNASPVDGNIYLFCNRQRKILKALYWDRNGFCLWQKRLEKHKFPWPQNDEAARAISYKELKMLLEGIDFWNAHQPLSYSSVK